MTAGRRSVWQWLQLALTIGVVGFAGWYLWKQWTTASENGIGFDFQFGWLAAASAICLLTFALLIETWRRVLQQLGANLSFRAAARVWFVSNLGKYVPGRIWAVTTMAMMAGEYGVSVGVVGASSAVLTAANVATGFSVVLLTSAGTVQQLAGGVAAVVAVTVGLFILLFATPWIATHWNRIATRFHRTQLSVSIPPTAILLAIAGTTVSWFLYGLAFMLLVMSIIGPVAEPYSAFVTANAASYLVGYLMIIAPAGIGFREMALVTILPALRIASGPQAALITVVSRLWLTVLEIVPSLIALATRRERVKAINPSEAGSRSG